LNKWKGGSGNWCPKKISDKFIKKNYFRTFCTVSTAFGFKLYDPKTIFFNKSIWVSKDAEFYAEFKSVNKLEKALTKKVRGQKLFDFLNKSYELNFGTFFYFHAKRIGKSAKKHKIVNYEHV